MPILNSNITTPPETPLWDSLLVKAVENKLADPVLLKQDGEALLALEEGRAMYMAHVRRPAVRRGATANTAKRYRAILDKFIAFAGTENVRYWQQVGKGVFDRYNAWLEDRDYHDKTQYTELTVLKQVLKWMVGEKLLTADSLFPYPLAKPTGTDTYCYPQAQVKAIVAHCRGEKSLCWFGDVAAALALTGLRISELAALKWSAVDMERKTITLADTSRRSRKSEREAAGTTKSHKDRSLPIHPDLMVILKGLPRRPDNLVFHGAGGGKVSPDKVLRTLKDVVLPALAERFPPVNGRPGITAGRVHSFRHAFCSWSADRGVSERMLMTWLGHSDSAMIRHYHQRDDESRRQMDKLPPLGREDETSGDDDAEGKRDPAGS